MNDKKDAKDTKNKVIVSLMAFEFLGWVYEDYRES